MRLTDVFLQKLLHTNLQKKNTMTQKIKKIIFNIN